MFLSAIALALVAGALAGGGLPRLAGMRLRWLWLLGAALALRILAYGARSWGVDPGIPLGTAFIVAYVLIFAWLWGNWRVPGLQVAAVGIGLNTIAVLINGGQMPVWSGALGAAGLSASQLVTDPFHFLLETSSVADFVRQGGIFGDVVPFPVPFLRDVVSLGDVLLSLGIFWAIVASMTRPNAPVRPLVALAPRTTRMLGGVEIEAEVAYGSAYAAAGPAGRGPMVAATSPAMPATAGVAVPGERAQSPYLRLVRNANFALLWIGQLISVFGDRLDQVALGFLVATRGDALEVGITFAMTAAPSVVLGPLAGALADRWDRRWTMVGCDLLRAGLVLLVPLVIDISIVWVYVVAFAVATVTLVFRPAKVAIVPLVAPDRDLVTANSAVTMTETMADLLGYPAAGLLVAALGNLVGAAFVIDSLSYVVSAVLLWSMALPATERVREKLSIGAVWSEMIDGWQFLRRQTELFSNTIVSAVSQVAVGAEVACSLLYAQTVLDRSTIEFPFNYSLLMAAIGLGSIAGGVVIGAIADRFPKGPMAIVGFFTFGVVFVVAGFVRDPIAAMVIFFGIGAANMVFMIPNITLFQQRTPQRLMGRVVSTRQALVFGVMALSMGVAGWLSGVLGPEHGPAIVMAGGGAICALAAVAAIFVPSIRNAR